MTKKPVIILGSANTDLVITCEILPSQGETVLGGDLQTFQGGKGANQAVAAARFGAEVHFLGRVGDDAYGQATRRALQVERIHTGRLLDTPGVPSGVALILVGQSGENLIAVAPGANSRISPEDVETAEDLIGRCALACAQLEAPLSAVEKLAALCAKHGVPFVLNPAPARELPASLLSKTDVLIPNEHEAEALTGESDPVKAAEALLAAGPPLVIITLGAEGCLAATRAGQDFRPAIKVEAVDTVAAGDCFVGVFCAVMADGGSPEECIRWAQAASAYSVTRKGAQPSLPTRAEVVELLDTRET